MQQLYPLAARAAHLLRWAPACCLTLLPALLLLPGRAGAQAPVITATAPAANAPVPARNSSVTVTFDRALSAGSAAALKVFSSQRGGLRTLATPATVSGSTLTFVPSAYDFLPGETVNATVTTAAQSSAGTSLAAPRVWQFTVPTTAATGSFAAKTDFATASGPVAVAVGDVNGDGLPDMVTATTSSTVSVRLGTGTAALFGSRTDFPAGNNCNAVVLGDVNGDGRLDLVTANTGSASAGVSVLLGTGTAALFAAKVDFATGSSPAAVALGDVNGDGRLDIVTANISTSGTVGASVLLGTGTAALFGPKTDFATGGNTNGVALGDVNGDGRLDIVTANYGSAGAAGASVLLGTGTAALFAAKVDFATGSNPAAVALGDVNGDGRLDMVLSNSGSTGAAGASVLLGTGTTALFGPKTDFATGNLPYTVALGDVNGDGRLDMAVSNNGSGLATVSVLLGTGTAALFGAKTDFTTGLTPAATLGDVNGDGRLDIVAANFGNTAGTAGASVLLGRPLVPTLTAISPVAELPGQVVVLTGTNFGSGSTVSFGGVAASSVTYTSASSLTATVPVGAVAGSSAVVVSNSSTLSASSPAFEVLQVYRAAAASGCLTTASLALTGTGGAGAWRYLRLAGAGGAVVAAIEDTYNLGTVAVGFTALGTGTASAVRKDSRNRAYLDRNFYLTATNKTFPGQSVQVRFYGLSSELSRLTAADANATAATLKASQYSGPNENCDLTDNNSTTGESRLLAAPATVLSEADWFTAQVTVADHFSEFYLTGASTPLPVQLTAFTATASGATSVALAWATASEANSSRFEVERSLDGVSYDEVGEVAAAGSSATARPYAYLDGRAPAGLLYYRLRQVDVDGTAAYSSVRSVVVGSSAGPRLYPNPALAGRSTVAGLPAGTRVAVYDLTGRRLSQRVADAEGTAALVLPAGLPAGVYVVQAGSRALRLVVE